MQIGALGFVNSAQSQIDVGQANASQNSGFASLLSGLSTKLS